MAASVEAASHMIGEAIDMPDRVAARRRASQLFRLRLSQLCFSACLLFLGMDRALALTAQTVAFGSLSPKAVTSVAFTVSATASSGLPISFSSSTLSVCSVSGSTVSVFLQGTCTITASQSGDGTYAPATNVSRSFRVVSAISAGLGHACVLKTNGTVQCWGYNGYGQLGNGTVSPSSTPVTVSGLSGASAITASEGYSCAVKADGTLQCWGSNSSSQFGDVTPSGTVSTTPVTVNGLSNVIEMAGGSQHACALDTNGTVRCLGDNVHGQLGNGTLGAGTKTPTLVSGLSGASAIAAGRYHTCARKVDGTVQCWGDDSRLQLGNGTPSLTPVTIVGLSAATAIAAAGDYTCSRANLVQVQCWGATPTGLPFDSVTGLSGVSAIAAGLTHACALKTDGTVQCWGSNGYGQLGNGSVSFSPTPVTVSGLSGAIAIAAGWDFSCALKSNGTVQCWGYNGYGQLGNGTFTISNTPVTVAGAGGLGTFNVASLTEQAIAFSALSTQVVTGTPFTISGAASSGLVVSFSSTTPGLCTVSGNVVNLLATGSCTIVAEQAGNENFAAAPAVIRSFAVTAEITGSADVPTLPEWGALLLGMTLLMQVWRRKARQDPCLQAMPSRQVLRVLDGDAKVCR
jgi:alpha-tubulin suppressor-like RCC1 family protein